MQLNITMNLTGGLSLSVQGILQYMRLVEGCLPLILRHERRHGLRFHWVLRTRVDTYWQRAPPTLSLAHYSPSKYSIPFGTDCSGYNDRHGGMDF